ncbi:hypothetical protein, partial [Bradyrhizobium sp. Leo170]|uniref:hypothetical protein n=1 Tax=Bradyrhizobium sp. Leo170 TaxID=1571199 RepID=UPI001A91309D
MPAFAGMTVECGYASAFSRHELPELCVYFTRLEKERAQGRPGADCTRGPRATKSTGVGPQVNRSNAGLPCAMVLTVSFVLSPVTAI